MPSPPQPTHSPALLPVLLPVACVAYTWAGDHGYNHGPFHLAPTSQPQTGMPWCPPGRLPPLRSSRPARRLASLAVRLARAPRTAAQAGRPAAAAAHHPYTRSPRVHLERHPQSALGPRPYGEAHATRTMLSARHFAASDADTCPTHHAHGPPSSRRRGCCSTSGPRPSVSSPQRLPCAPCVRALQYAPGAPYLLLLSCCCLVSTDVLSWQFTPPARRPTSAAACSL